MRITQLKISNYKSLRSVEFVPTPLSVVVGANASGKSNLADCLDFISEVYRLGLEVAVARKGGYENIAFRKQRRSRQQIEVQIEVEFSIEELRSTSYLALEGTTAIRVEHSFAFVAQTRAIDAPFKIVKEALTVGELNKGHWNRSPYLKATEDGTTTINEPIGEDSFAHLNWDWLTSHSTKLWITSVNPSMLRSGDKRFPAQGVDLASRFVQAIGSIRVYQINPHNSRDLGVPTPQPELGRFGSNLPAVVDRMRKDAPEAWASVMETMFSVLPDLSDIDVAVAATSRQLALFFKEGGFGRPWNVAEVSDGTIQTLALLVAIFKPGPLALVLEEPENSVHPWVIRHIVDACRQASANKQIILTTHSPIVINRVRPEEVWVIWRENGESQLKQLVQLDQRYRTLWDAGAVSTFEYLDSGAAPEAVPPAPAESLLLDEVG